MPYSHGCFLDHPRALRIGGPFFAWSGLHTLRTVSGVGLTRASLEDEFGRRTIQHQHEDLQEHPVKGRVFLLQVRPP